MGESDIVGLQLAVHPRTLQLCGRRLLATDLEAQVSVFHWAACALLHPGQWVIAAGEASTGDAHCRALQHKIQMAADPSLGRAQARARLTLASGEVREADVQHATASSGNPMTTSQLDEKFLMLAGTALPADRALALLHRCRALGAATTNPMSILESAR